MDTPALTRERILEAFAGALEPLDYTHAMWEGGAAALDRIDQWSDIDLMIDVDDECVDQVLEVIQSTVLALSPIDLKFELPRPTWHGHAQVFYRLQEASEYLLLDIVVMKHSNLNKFLERELHGDALVHFDKSGVVQPPPFDHQAHTARLKERLATMLVTFDLFQMLTKKELNRGNAVEALVFYQSYTLRPLVEALRIHYKPEQYNFHTRYIYHDFPRDVVRRLEALYFVSDADDLERKRQLAEDWFHQILDEFRKDGWFEK